MYSFFLTKNKKITIFYWLVFIKCILQKIILNFCYKHSVDELISVLQKKNQPKIHKILFNY